MEALVTLFNMTVDDVSFYVINSKMLEKKLVECPLKRNFISNIPKKRKIQWVEGKFQKEWKSMFMTTLSVVNIETV